MRTRIGVALTKALLALIVAGILASERATAQSSAGGGSIQGTVRDDAGAAVPGANIKITHLATGRQIETETNGAGFYSTPTVNIGQYKIRVESPGMKAWEGRLEVETGRSTVVDTVMTIGNLTDTVVVEGNITPLVTTNEPTQATTLDRLRIQELPLNGRDLNILLEAVTPGLESTVGGTGGVRVGGLMVQATDYVQDGAAAVNRELGGIGYTQGLESVQEVRVETSTSSAKYNRPATVILTTKSGTNDIHGSLFETHRNNGFGVARARQDVFFDGREFKAPKLIRNEFGGSIGGPIFLPRFGEGGKVFYNGKNRSFFFFAREGLELRQGITRDFRVPTQAMRAGDFSGLIDSQGRRITLYDPLTTRPVTQPNGFVAAVRDPFPNNQVPLSRLSPLTKRIYDITPLPNDITNPLVAANLRTVVPTNIYPNLSDNPTTVRLDHRFGEKDNAYLKLNGGKRDNSFIGNGSSGPPTLNNEANMTYFPSWSFSGAVGWTHTFSPSFYVETLVNRTWQSYRVGTGPSDVNWSREFGLPNPFDEIGWPNITGTGFATYTEGDNRRAASTIITNIDQNYTLVRGNHQYQFGGRYHHERLHLLLDQGAISGSVGFNSAATALHHPDLSTPTEPVVVELTGHDSANFFLGIGNNYSAGLKRKWMRLRERTIGLYFQDNYKVNQRLTLNLGVRWDISPVTTEKNNLLSSFDLQNRSVVTPEPLSYYYNLGLTSPQIVSLYQQVGVQFKSAEEVGIPKTLYNPNYYDISPRAGFAYKILEGNKEFVIRGGYGYYIFPVPLRNTLANFSGSLPFTANYSMNLNSDTQSPDGLPAYLLRSVPAIFAGVNSADVIDINSPVSVNRGQTVFGFVPDQQNSRVHEWNLTLEKEIAANTVIRLIYQGKHATKLEQRYNINPQPNNFVWYVTTGQPVPTGTFGGVARRVYDQTAYTDVIMYGRTGYANTQLLTIEFQRRFRQGLGFQAHYTLSNALRNAGNGFRDSLMTRPEQFLPGTVPENFDELNRFLNYRRDIDIPKHRVRWNWQYELPVGKGKWLLGKSGGLINALVGGWKLAGLGTITSTWFGLPTNHWGEMGNLEIYGKKYKITDCRATPATATQPNQERCTDGYLWFNGYISERVINSHNAAGLRNGVFGLPENYRPAIKPRTPWPKGGLPTDPNAADYDTNFINIDLKDGSTVRVGYDTGLHPWRQQYLLGPYNWSMDASLFKFFKIGERFNLRLNADFFNVLNIQGLNGPGGEGIASLGRSFDGNGFRPRQMQLSLRLDW
jgi:Carboxypeptidase regulatory-like domain/TonB dependent receptor